jgi:hypothetical protein
VHIYILCAMARISRVTSKLPSIKSTATDTATDTATRFPSSKLIHLCPFHSVTRNASFMDTARPHSNICLRKPRCICPTRAVRAELRPRPPRQGNCHSRHFMRSHILPLRLDSDSLEYPPFRDELIHTLFKEAPLGYPRCVGSRSSALESDSATASCSRVVQQNKLDCYPKSVQ